MQTHTKYRFMLVAATLIFGTVGIFRRYIPLPSGFIALSRSIIGALFLLLVMIIIKRKPDWTAVRKKLPLLIAAGLALSANWIFLFESYRYTTVATTTLCYYMAPSAVMLLSPLLFSERLTLRRIICAAASVAGIVLVSGASGSAGNVTGILTGLAAAAFYATVTLLNKAIGKLDMYMKTLVQFCVAAPALLVYSLLSEHINPLDFTPMVIVLLIAVGILHTGVAFTLYFGAVGRLPAQTTALLCYVDPVTAVLLSALILSEPMHPQQIAGAVLIIGSAIIGELPRKGAIK